MKKVDVYAYYFPNWHVDKLNEAWHGKGWTEWELLKCARPRFEGHEQPLVPLWGYEDEADPKVMAKKIDTALEYGIDGFIFDFYYYQEETYRARCIDEGFLQAPNNEKMKFAIMWCNHDAIYAHPAPRFDACPVLRSGKLTEEQFVLMTNMYIEKYFSRPNYIRVNGKILFAIYNVARFCKDFDGVENARRIVDGFRQRVRDAGLGEVWICCHAPDVKSAYLGKAGEEVVADKIQANAMLKGLGIDQGVRYWWPTHHCDDPRFEEYALTVDYKDYVDGGIDIYYTDLEFFDIPVAASISIGLDNSPRTIQSETYENLEVYPWGPIVVGRDLTEFERGLRTIKEIAEKDNYPGNFVTINSWNEWTEGNYLEPDTVYGYGFLQKIKKIFK